MRLWREAVANRNDFTSRLSSVVKVKYAFRQHFAKMIGVLELPSRIILIECNKVTLSSIKDNLLYNIYPPK
jgi:hypothetical protein